MLEQAVLALCFSYHKENMSAAIWMNNNVLKMKNNTVKVTNPNHNSVVCNRCAAQSEKMLCDFRENIRWPESFSVSRTNHPTAVLHELKLGLTWDGGWKTKHLSSFNLSPRCGLRVTLTCLFHFAFRGPHGDDKSRSHEHHGTLYPCFWGWNIQ